MAAEWQEIALAWSLCMIGAALFVAVVLAWQDDRRGRGPFRGI